MIAIVDKADAEQVLRYNWHAVVSDKIGKLFYAARWVGTYPNRQIIKMHRWLLGVTDPSNKTDHRNGNSLDNRRCNLRQATQGQNCSNGSLSRSSTTGIRGVNLTSDGRKWRARISAGNKSIALGSFQTKEDAAQAYREAAKRIHGEFSFLNRQQNQSTIKQ